MKKTLILTAVALLAGVVSGYSQGEITFYGKGTGLTQSIWNQQPSGWNTTLSYSTYGTIQEIQGSTSASTEVPAGNTVYAAGTSLGGSVSAGTGFDAQLLAVAGANQPLSALVPTGGILNFATAAAAVGAISGSAGDVIPGTQNTGYVATIAIAAWNNGGGAYTTLAAAVAHGEPWGISALANITSVPTPGTPANMDTASDLNFSFSLGTALTPEPSTIALGVMGASALLFRRRK